MQVTIDIPEPIVSELEASARLNRMSLQEVLVRGAFRESRRSLSSGESELSRAIREGTNLNDIAIMTDDEFEEFAGH